MAITVQVFLSPVSGESLALAVQGAFEKLLRQTGEPWRDQKPIALKWGTPKSPWVSIGFKTKIYATLG